MIEALHWSEVDNWPSKHFSPEELACRGTGKIKIDEDALAKLEKLREMLGKPMIINSAYRSPEHNRKVGGAKNSNHMQGVAFDVRMDNHDPEKFERLARKCGFTGFGYYPASGFMHIDTGKPRVWGTKFKPRPTRFKPDEVAPEKITKSKTAQTGVVTGTVSAGFVAGEAAMIAEKLQDSQDQLSSGDFVGITIGLLTLAGIVYMLYRRWVAAGKPKLSDIVRGVL